MTQHTVTFDELGISPADIYVQMGYADTMPDDTTRQEVDFLLSEVRQWLAASYCYFVSRILPAFHLGSVITRQLQGSEAYALFICTCGLAFDSYLQRLKDEGDLVRVFIADALGSVIAERCADCMEQNLQQSIDKLGWHHTNRFSPGYCGWHVSEQQLLFPLFDGQTCGVRLTDSSLMLPIKSVSGIIGIGSSVRHLDYTCGLCDMENCCRRNNELRIMNYELRCNDEL